LITQRASCIVSLMLASRIFDAEDQARFAALTGDYNPMHVDPVAARRTQAGAPVVHGIHALLWLLDVIAARHPEIAGIASLNVRFPEMIYVGDQVDAEINRLTADTLRARVHVGGVEVIRMSAAFGPVMPAPRRPIEASAKPISRQTAPRDLALQEIEGRSGRVCFAAGPVEMEREFPNASRLLGARRVGALGCSTCLVGMIVPGLHSIYGGLDLHVTVDTDPADELGFAVMSVDLRFRRVLLEIIGGGLAGSLDTYSC
jgi:acyl dehydratase